MLRPLVSPTRQPLVCAPVRPNKGVEAAYQRKLDTLIAQMNKSVLRSILATYREKPPAMAQDESSPAALRATIARLSSEWGKRFDDFAQSAARKFSKDAIGSADRAFMASLRDVGFTVRWRMTKAANEIMQATIAEQVGLIRSIPEQMLTQVQGSVMRSVTAGHDMATLAKELEHQFGVTKRRAATIARDQSSKATASITMARQLEAGITTARWLHSSGGKQPRVEHVKASGKTYEIAKGMWLEDRWTWPGREVNCRCVSVALIPGIDD